MTQKSKVTSQYLQTPINAWYLDIWVPREIPASDTDTLMTITAKYEERPDLLSYDLYGTPRLWWIIALRNKDVLIDPIADFLPGVQIYLPKDILK
jgi:Base plate wedge protein 53